MATLATHLAHIGASADDARRGVAFFDLDRTLVNGYSILAMAMETARHAAQRGQLAQSGQLLRDVLRQQGEPGGGNYHRLVRRLAKALTGLTEDTLTLLGQQACERHLQRNLYREAVNVIEAHRRAGHHLVIVSAASPYQVRPVAELLGIDDICCTQLAVADGRFTGEVVAPLCYGEGKLMAARRVLRKQRARLADSWFYTDSSADLPLLRKVGHPVAVNPSEKLQQQAAAQGWPVLDFTSRGLPTLAQLVRTSLVAQTVVASAAVGSASRWLGLDANGSANRMTRLLGELGSAFAGLDYEIEGAEHLCPDRPAVYVFNHQSLLDAVVLARLLRGNAVALCKRELESNPLLAPLLKQADTIFVERAEKDQRRVLAQALSVLAEGRSLVIAPEGTRSTLGRIQPFKMGAFVLARRAGVPIVPIVLHNVKDALPKGGALVRPATIRVSVLPPLAPEGMRDLRRSCAELEQAYSEMLSQSPQAALPQLAQA